MTKRSKFVCDIEQSITLLIYLRDEEEKEARARRVVRANNFTQQTNTLDVDKHMCVIVIIHVIGEIHSIA